MGWVVGAMVPAVGAIALFSFLAVATWAEQRRKERESYYRYEFRKKLVEAGEMNTSQLQALMHFEYETEMSRRRQSMVAGGFIVAGVGLGILFGLRFIGEGVWMVGYIPLFLGVGMLLYALLFAPKSVPTPPVGVFPKDPARD